MGAPTNAANVKKVLANSEPSTHGGKADIALGCRPVCFNRTAQMSARKGKANVRLHCKRPL